MVGIPKEETGAPRLDMAIINFIFRAAQQQAAAAARILCGVPGYVIKGSSLRKCRSLRLIRKENRNSRWHTVCVFTPFAGTAKKCHSPRLVSAALEG